MKATIVLTTIRVPELLLSYVDNFEKYGHADIGFIVIGDRKTPNKANKKLVDTIKNRGFCAEYWDPPRQERYLTQFPGLSEIIPWDSDCRRNLGYLLAYEQGAEIIITIDDDNFVTSDDFYGKHSIVGTFKTLKTASSANKWFNPCSLLETNPRRKIYPRGFPYCRRWSDSISWGYSNGRVVLNMGLWLNHPDVDAITNLNEPVRVTGLKSEQIMLSPGTYAPINTQNTAFHRCVLPAYYYIPMRARIHGMILDRYGDIWSGLFVKKIIDQKNDRVTIGKPLTDHRRNPHNLIKDLQSEIWGILITEYLAPAIESIELEGRTYADLYLDLAEKLSQLNFHPDKTVKKYFEKMSDAMRIWVDVCEKL